MATGARIALGYLNRGLDAEWTASSEEPTLPAKHLATRVRTEVWQGAPGALTNQWIKGHLATIAAIAMGALVESNLTTAATVRLQGNATDSWGAPAYDEPFEVWDQSRTRLIPQIFAAPHSLAWWRWTFDDPTNPDNCLRVGVPFLSPTVVFTRGPKDYRVTRLDPSVASRSAGQTPRAWKLPKLWRVQWLQRQIDGDVLFGTLFDAYESLGTSEDGVCCVVADAPGGTALARGSNIYGRFETMPENAFTAPPDDFQGPMSFIESR
jgi:hypothetical protein